MTRPLDQALDDLRISGSVLLAEAYATPWAIDLPEQADLRAALGLAREVRVVPFHFVQRGGFDLAYAGRKPQRVKAGEVAICPSGAPHRMSDGEWAEGDQRDGGRTLAVADVLAGRAKPSKAQPGQGTGLICGIFMLRAAPLNPLLAALPDVLTVDTGSDTTSKTLRHAAAILQIEVGKGPASFIASRLLEVFFAEAVRTYGEGEGRMAAGWFRGLDDVRIGEALARLHEDPGAPWSVALLANTVAMSPSRFAARFRETTGQSVLSYVSAWRMSVACRSLRESDDNLDAIAGSVGYADVASFSRAFKALVGESPARWRAGQ